MTIEADVFRHMAVETSSESLDDYLTNFPAYIGNLTDPINNHPVLSLVILVIIVLIIGAVSDRRRSGKWFFQ